MHNYILQQKDADWQSELKEKQNYDPTLCCLWETPQRMEKDNSMQIVSEEKQW
jgi:hypothetical protein